MPEGFIRKKAVRLSDPLFVAIPCRNEQNNIKACLDSFCDQTDQDFILVIVDNGSTDTTSKVIKKWLAGHPRIRAVALQEIKEGTGQACNKGFGYAVSRGASMIARTDADCVLSSSWVAEVKQSLRRYDAVAGALQAQASEQKSLIYKSIFLLLGVRVAVVVYRIVKHQISSTTIMAGGNMAVTAELYEAMGGFTTKKCNEDIELQNRILRATRNFTVNKNMVVYTSLRRIRQYGFWQTLMGYIKKLSYT